MVKMFSVTTVLGALVLLAILALVIKNIKKNGMDAFSTMLLTIIFWLLLMVALPEITSNVTALVGFKKTETAFLSLISVTALFLAIRNHFRQNDIGSEITGIARELALRPRGKK